MEILISEPGLWNWPAIIVGSIGGLASGAAAGLAAWFVFRLGLKAEREKVGDEENKRRAELAFRALLKAQDWMHYGWQTYDLVRTCVEDGRKEKGKEFDMTPLVPPMLDSNLQPETIDIEELSFLASRDPKLIMKLYNIQRWGYYVNSLAAQYTRERLDWGQWALANYQWGATDKLRSMLSNKDFAVEAEARANRMEGLLLSILEDGDQAISKHRDTISNFINACREAFRRDFPDVEYKWTAD